MLYCLYQITNLLTGSIYVGVHASEHLEDSYMGSGVYISRAIKKYGVENFKKTILETFDSVEDMFTREAEIVTLEFIHRDDTYNLVEGGRGLRAGTEYVKQFSAKGRAKQKELGISVHDPRIQQMGVEVQRQRGTGIFDPIHQKEMIDKSHSVKSEAKRSKTFKERGHSKGAKNPNYGKKWIHNPATHENLRVLDPTQYLLEGWLLGVDRTTELWKQISYNSQKRWVTKGGVSKSIPATDLDNYLQQGWVRGRSLTNLKRGKENE